jgi:hypothetical protein
MVKAWSRGWRVRRLGSVVTGYAGDEDAVRLTLAQREEVEAGVAAKPSGSGVPVGFWDVPASGGLVRTRSGMEYRSGFSSRLVTGSCGVSSEPAAPFDGRRDEEAVTARTRSGSVAGVRRPGVEVFTADEVRVEHEAETRRRGSRPVSGPRSTWTANASRSRSSGPWTSAPERWWRTCVDGNQNTGQTVLVLDRPDDAGRHTSKELMRWFETGQQFEDVTLIRLPRTRRTADHTFTAFELFVKNGVLTYDFEHLPIPTGGADLV